MRKLKDESGLFFSRLVPQQTKSHGPEVTPLTRNELRSLSRDTRRLVLERPYECPPADPRETSFRHSGWRVDRVRVRAALQAANCPPARLTRFDGCGSDCVVEWSPARGRHRLRANYCGDRFCVPCCTARSHEFKRRLTSWVGTARLRFITLTLRGDERPLCERLTHLLRAFLKLRRSRLWSDKVAGGVYVVEITRGAAGNFWHVHLHVLCIGSYIDGDELKDAWRRASGGSFVTDVREVKDKDRGVGYVAKYASKGFDRSVLQDPDSLCECILALRGRRLFGTFGEWRNCRLEDPDSGPADWTRVDRLVNVLAAADQGEPWARGILIALRMLDLAEITREPPS